MSTGIEARLGSITCPSGRLVLADTGYLGLWSGDRPPVADEAVLAQVDDAALRESILASADLTVVGPDADEAARTFDPQAGIWLYDIPGHAVGEFTAAFAEHCRTHRLDARLEREEGRVTHRERAERCALAGGQQFLIHGVPMIAIGGLPTGERLEVTATRRDYGRIGECWESAHITVSASATASSRFLGHIGVDAARISLIDAGALNRWQHEEPIDGLADVAFWGRSVKDAATAFNTALLGLPGEEHVYGWTDLPVGEAVDRAIALEEWKGAEPGRGLAVDFRPHSHHWQVMAQVRATEHKTGTIRVGGAETMCFMTGWGDGFFPVHADRDADGNLVRLRIDLGGPERQARLEAMRQ